MNNLILREWNQKTIRQSKDGQYLSGTDMCSSVGKKFKDWFKTDAAQQYLNALSEKILIPIRHKETSGTKIPTAQPQGFQALIEVIQGGEPQEQGTWIHRKVALRLAQWLSPELAVQVDSWIEELFEKGSVSLQQHPEAENSLDRLEMLFEIATGMFAEYREQKKTLAEHSQKIKENSSLIEQAQENLETTINVVENLEKLVKEKKAEYSDVDNIPVALNEYCAFKNIQINKGLNGVGRALTKLCSRTGIEYFNAPIGQKNKYPFWLLKELFKTSADFECNAKSLLLLYLNSNESNEI